MSGDGPVEAERGKVTGTATYADGRPLEGATILVNGREYATQAEVTTGPDGTYSAQLAEPRSSYVMYAWVGPVELNGATYVLPLDFVDGDPGTFSGNDAVVADLVWNVEGHGTWASHLQPDDPEAFNGSSFNVSVYDRSNDPGGADAIAAPAGTEIEVTLDPVTSLVDGSRAGPLTETITFEEATHGGTVAGYISAVGEVVDVPIATYDVTATLVELDGTETPLLVGWRCTQRIDGVDCPFSSPTPLAPSARVEFLPESSIAHGAPYDSQPGQSIELYVHTG